MDKKIYALHYQKPSPIDDGYKLKISSEKHWLKQTEMLQNSSEEVIRYNDCIYLSFSRKALVTKAKEIKEVWVEEEKKRLEQIKNLIIK